LGGLVEGDAGGEDGHNHTHDQAYSGCSTMQDVWKTAKCMNMTDDPMFPKFEDLIDNDPRKYPHGYECNYTGITQEMIDVAKGRDVKFDKVETYLDMLYPTEDEEGNATCHDPIRTGVTVVRMESAGVPIEDCFENPDCGQSNAPEEARISQEKQYEDGLCITIGCSYQNTDGGEGECVVK
jgi:hypothetical protein